MTKYKVLPIAMSVRNNRLAKHGEIVDDSELTTNPASLIAEGFLRLLTDEELSEIEPEKSDDLDPDNKREDDDSKALLENRRSILIDLGFVPVDSDGLLGISLPDTNVLFSNDDLSNASLEEFDAFLAQATTFKASKGDDTNKVENTESTKVEEAKKDETVSKKDEVKASLTKK